MKLHETGAYLVNGCTVVEDNSEAPAAIAFHDRHCGKQRRSSKKYHCIRYFKGPQHIWQHGEAENQI